MAFEWTSEKLRAKSTKEVLAVLENARSANNTELIAMCEAVLAERGGAGARPKPTAARANRGRLQRTRCCGG
jgi:hypothetical protein